MLKLDTSLLKFDRRVHEPARFVLLALLAHVGSADFLYLLKETGLSKGNLSFHLMKLEEAGFVYVEKTYRRKIPRTICHMTAGGWEAWSRYRERMDALLAATRYGPPQLWQGRRTVGEEAPLVATIG